MNQTFDYNLQKCKHLSPQPTAFNIKHPGMVWVHEEILKMEEDILSFKEAALSAWIEPWPAGHRGKPSPQMKDHLTKWFENSLWWTVTNNSMGGKEEKIGSLDRKDDSCGQLTDFMLRKVWRNMFKKKIPKQHQSPQHKT